jgi:threonine/homoserine/homoserine lactone efflux protein
MIVDGRCKQQYRFYEITMNLLAFSFALFALLILPGPTNTVLVMSAQGLKLQRALALLATVAVAYMTIVVPVFVLAGPLLHDHATVGKGVKLLSAAWVLYLAARLWSAGPEPTGSSISLAALFVTTVLNPKAIVIGLTLIPSADSLPPVVSISTLAFIVLATSTIWLTAGHLILCQGPRAQMLAQRFGSAVLLIFSIALTASALS